MPPPLRDVRPLALRQTWRPGRPPLRRIGEPLAERVQPDHLAPQRDGLGEQRRVRRDRDAQAGLHQIRREPHGVGRVRRNRGDVGEQVLGRNGRGVALAQFCENGRAQVWRGPGAIRPKREDTPSKRTFVVVVIWYQRCCSKAWTRCWRSTSEDG